MVCKLCGRSVRAKLARHQATARCEREWIASLPQVEDEYELRVNGRWTIVRHYLPLVAELRALIDEAVREAV